MKPTTPLLALCMALTTAPALADDDCEAPVEHWQSRDAVMRHAAAQGWQVQRIKIDDGCYEVRGRDAEGRAFEAKLAPQTLRVVKMKLRDGEHARERERRHDRNASLEIAPVQETAPAAATAPVHSPVLTPGITPRRRIE